MSSFVASFNDGRRGIRKLVGKKRVVLLVSLFSFALILWYYHRHDIFSPTLIAHYRDGHPVLSILLFTLVYAVSVIALVPSLPLNLAAGFFWGGLAGGLYATLGGTIGCWVSFLIARWVIGQPLAEKFDHRWMGIIQQEFDRGGWKFVAFARINPIIPTGPLNYLLGLTSLSNRKFILTTFFFLLPSATAFSYVGDSLQSLTDQQGGAKTVYHAMLAASAAITIVAVIGLVRRVSRSRASSASYGDGFS